MVDSRAKGARGELEVQAIFRDYKWHLVRRNWQSGGQGGGDLVGTPDVVEVKRTKKNVRFWEWVEQARSAASDNRWCLWVRRDAGTWHVVVDSDRYMELIYMERTIHQLHDAGICSKDVLNARR